MKAILERELKSYLFSPIVYVIGFFYVIVSLIFFFLNNVYSGNPDLSALYDNLNMIMIFLVPIITMRLFSEEKSQRTDQLLLTSPNPITSIVFGKYLSALVIYAVLLAFTLVYALVLGMYGVLNIPSFLMLFLGAFLLGCAFISVGLFISSIFGSVVVSSLVTLGILMLCYFADLFQYIAPNSVVFYNICHFFSLATRYYQFILGLFSLDGIIYYLSFSAIFIFLTIRIMDKKRWE